MLQLSNGDVYEKTHDELDFEFLGSRWGGQWRVQTNVYGNGSTSHGREERYLLPFDPTLEAHSYSVLWAPTHIMYVSHSPENFQYTRTLHTPPTLISGY